MAAIRRATNTRTKGSIRTLQDHPRISCRSFSQEDLPWRRIQQVEVTSEAPEDVANSIRPFFDQQQPVLLRHAVEKAPAMQAWQSLDYFKETLPANEVARAEIGGNYSADSTDRAEIPIQEYLRYLDFFEERHGSQGGSNPIEDPPPQEIAKEEIVYLAQNDLPQSLYKDIQIPAFCEEEAYQVGHGRLYSVMLWLGPRGCSSPLHFDPLNNILMQFKGRKLVWLYPPTASGGWHYAGHDGQQSNTSPVNPEGKDSIAKYPLFGSEGPEAIKCVLSPGDALFIPSKWWHYVRSIDTSASVNVWWR